MTHEELVAKAREAKSAEEIMEIAKAEGMELTKEAAAGYYEVLNPQSGELSDEELDNVSGGGCKTKGRDGKKYTIVTSGTKCFTGQYIEAQNLRVGSLHKAWKMFSIPGCCGFCDNLGFDSKDRGYCLKS